MTEQAHYNIKGLYAVTPEATDVKLLSDMVQQALDGGAQLVQYRTQLPRSVLRSRQATALLALCKSYNVPLIINDHLDLCAEIDADGLHLGPSDVSLSAARSLLGADKIIGASCYDSLALAQQAQDAGASYVVFGACFPSVIKPKAPKAPLSLLVEAKRELTIPVVGAGGITVDNGSMVLEAGADALAVVTDLFYDEAIQKVAQQYSDLFKL